MKRRVFCGYLVFAFSLPEIKDGTCDKGENCDGTNDATDDCTGFGFRRKRRRAGRRRRRNILNGKAIRGSGKIDSGKTIKTKSIVYVLQS